MAPRILLIGWDAADWKMIHPLLDAGELPNLQRLVDGGVIGNIATLQPCLSPILWTSLVTGKTADKHGICGFVEPAPGANGLRLASSTSRTTKAIWNILSQRGFRSIVVGWYASHPAEPIEGVCISNRFAEDPPADPRGPWPWPDGAVHPPSLATTLADLRLHPAELEYEEMAAFMPLVGEIDHRADTRPLLLAQALAHTASVHNAATWAMESEPWDFCAVYYDALDVVGHVFMPYHPPRLDHVPARDFDLFCGVMRGLYRFHDQMLGRLLELAGDEATALLVSDHGFHSDHLRPRGGQVANTPEVDAAQWHRPYGVLVAHGRNVRADERVYGANLLDITPTILTMMGLPVGADMDGRVLRDLFVEAPPPRAPIPSWDAEPGDAYMHPAGERQDPYQSAAAIQRLVALGYLPPSAADVQTSIGIATCESRFNLAVVHLHHGRPHQARAILAELHARHPEQPRYLQALARACLDMGLSSEAQTLIERLEQRGIRSADGDLVLVASLFNQGEHEAASERIHDMDARYPPSANLQYLIGTLQLTRQRWEEAQRAFERGLTLDQDHAHCHAGLAQALLARRQPQSAAEHAQTATGLLYYYPEAHFHLGVAQAEQGGTEEAIRSLQTAVAQMPNHFEAHRHLARLFDQADDPVSSLRHRHLADGFLPNG